MFDIASRDLGWSHHGRTLDQALRGNWCDLTWRNSRPTRGPWSHCCAKRVSRVPRFRYHSHHWIHWRVDISKENHPQPLWNWESNLLNPSHIPVYVLDGNDGWSGPPFPQRPSLPSPFLKNHRLRCWLPGTALNKVFKFHSGWRLKREW